ncbi:hypothetical protein MBLNU230_g1369t1 [Neophaeotheca triangularis]
MADYDSDSSGAGDDIETNVLLGYASKEPTGDDFSQLGGHPIWLDGQTAPDGILAKCKVCNSLMNMYLQLNGDLHDRFPGHERRLYVFGCRRKACRRKEGSVRGFRATKVSTSHSKPAVEERKGPEAAGPGATENTKPSTNIGETLFGARSPTGQSSNANPFATPSSASTGSASANPFASASSLAAKPPQPPTTTTQEAEDLAATFAQKAKISSSPAGTPSQPPKKASTPEPWPEKSSFPSPYPTYYIDADKEYLEPPDTQPAASRARVDTSEASGGAEDNKTLFESAMDKTFQTFADRLAQNPEQILRYEHRGSPLLYSKTDSVGKMLAPADEAAGRVQTAGSKGGSSRMPRCGNCGGERVFELQLVPQAIAELEAEELGLEGMEWGTVILGTCASDCAERGKSEGGVGYVEEWVGVQWEEIASKGSK